MNPLNVIRGFDPDLYAYFEKELEHQRLSLSFIPDENSTSPLCAAIMGSVLVNTTKTSGYALDAGLETLTAKQICSLFNADHANIRTISIEAASRCVFQSLTKRGDIVMSLDLRKKEHCNSENLAYRFVNFSIDPKTQRLDMDKVEAQAKSCRPQMIVLSPINYPLQIDYARFAQIAKECGALLWCDISQIAGLIAGGALPTPVPYADVVTFSCHGAMQGPQADSRIRAPAPIRSASAPFSASMVSTCLEPGLIESSTSGATVLPRSIAATVIRSAREELVQLPMQT